MAEIHKRFLDTVNVVDNPNVIWKSENILRFYLPQFVLLLLCIVSLTRFIYYILRPFNQPHFVAEFLAALLLCPQIVNPGPVYDYVTPAKALLGVETIAHVGLIFNVFLTGLEMNLNTVMQARKKATTIAVVCTLVPMILGGAIYSLAQALYRNSELDMSLYNTPNAYLFWSLVLSVTNYPVLANILSDLKILYTGLGRVAVTASTINDFYNWAMFVMLIPFATHSRQPFVSVFFTMVFVIFCYFVLRPLLKKLVEKHMEEHELDNYKLSFVLLGVLICAHVTEMLGTHSIVGALVYGLILPRGEFAEMVIDRLNDIISLYLAPLFYFGVGVRFDFNTFRLYKLVRVVVILVLSCTPKIISSIIATGFYKMPLKDGVALGVLLNTKGILPIVMVNIASDREILSRDFYTLMVTASFLMTLLVPPTINYIYKPKKRFEKDKLRTIQNLKANADLRIMVCVHNIRQATGMINILQACTAPNATPLRVFAVQLLELKGRGTAILVDRSTSYLSQPDTDNITNMFAEFAPEQGHTTLENLAAVSDYETIHKDIYNIAEEKHASLILLPFHKQASSEGVLEEINPAFKEINQNVMHFAPCSVGILVDRSHGLVSNKNLRLAVLFIGGPDDREALAIAWRMAKHPRIHLAMIHVRLSGKVAEVDTKASTIGESNGLLSKVHDSGKEKQLDEEYVSLFRLMAVNNEDSITYSEKQVNTAEDVPLVLNELDKLGYDLYILGHGKGRNSKVLSNLLEWTDCPELGVIGDMLASNSFGSSSSVLVVQQYGFGGTNFKAFNQAPKNNGDVEAIFGKAV